jgi:hypothetical protein
LSQRVGFLTQESLISLFNLSSEIGRMLTGLRHALEAKID